MLHVPTEVTQLYTDLAGSPVSAISQQLLASFIRYFTALLSALKFKAEQPITWPVSLTLDCPFVCMGCLNIQLLFLNIIQNITWNCYLPLSIHSSRLFIFWVFAYSGQIYSYSIFLNIFTFPIIIRLIISWIFYFGPICYIICMYDCSIEAASLISHRTCSLLSGVAMSKLTWSKFILLLSSQGMHLRNSCRTNVWSSLNERLLRALLKGSVGSGINFTRDQVGKCLRIKKESTPCMLRMRPAPFVSCGLCVSESLLKLTTRTNLV